jgi:hypothetical protein
MSTETFEEIKINAQNTICTFKTSKWFLQIFMVTMCKTIIEMSELVERCNNHITEKVRQQLESLEYKLPLPEKIIWIMFNNYCLGLQKVQVLFIKASYLAMQSLFSHIPGEACAMSSTRNFLKTELNENGLLSLYNEHKGNSILSFFYDTGRGQYDDYIFMPNTINQATILSIIGDENHYADSRLFCPNSKIFENFMSITLSLLEKVPWIGFVKSFPDCVYFQLFLKSSDRVGMGRIIDGLRQDEITYGLLTYDNGFMWEEYGDLCGCPIASKKSVEEEVNDVKSDH